MDKPAFPQMNVSRFDRYYRKADGCWFWLRSANSFGYGVFYMRGKTVGAHRAAWIRWRGEIPEGMFVLHKCDNKTCVNPDHLYLGDAKDNARDALERGQFPTGKRNGRHTQPERTARFDQNGNGRLTKDDCLRIAKRFHAGERMRDIAADVGVHVSCAYRAKNRADALIAELDKTA